MARLRHIAITAKDPWATALFYMEAFGMKKVGETDNDGALGVYLSDGVMNLAILKYKNDAAAGPLGCDFHGVHHFGFWVDDIAAAQARTVEAGGRYFMGESKADNSFYEIKYFDPNGVVVDLSASGWAGASKEGVAKGDEPKLSKPALVADRSALGTA